MLNDEPPDVGLRRECEKAASDLPEHPLVVRVGELDEREDAELGFDSELPARSSCAA